MKTSKILIGLIAFLALFSGACKKDSFDYKMATVTVADIDSIYFSAGDVMMIADGKATLQFIVETYKKFKRSDGSVTREFVDFNELPAGSVKVFEEVTNKEIPGMTFSTATMPADTLRFYAQVGSVKSEVKKVALRPAPALPPKVYVDVIFHVWELNPTNRQFDLSSYLPTRYEDLLEGLRVMNEVVNNRIGNASNGASANVEFRMAKKNRLGQDLPQPGYNKIVYSDEVKATVTAATISLADMRTYINNNAATYIWEPSQFLNIHVLPSGATNNSLGKHYPPKQLPPGPNEELIPGITGIATGPDDYIRDFVNATVYMPNTLFHPGPEQRIEIFSFVGHFYGLYPTSEYSTARYHSDYCEDTREYDPQDPRNNFFVAKKVGINGDKFIINNAMDNPRYPSMRNSLTLDQVARMRAVMARCPGRMNTKDQ